MVKIYFDNKPLFLTDDKQKVEDYLHRPETLLMDESESKEVDEHSIRAMIQQMKQDNYETGVFLYYNTRALLEAFKPMFAVIQAAGGLVHNPKKEILLIYRRQKWDLPKGKLDEGEDLEECAIREIKEETGLKQVAIERPLTTSYHTYTENGHEVLKETHWFLMKAKEQKLAPQTEEDIEKAVWVPIAELENYMTGTYGIVREVVKEGLGLLKA
jgi:ADP-ribose pyrophosphatase YjhB (NUDIX family)